MVFPATPGSFLRAVNFDAALEQQSFLFVAENPRKPMGVWNLYLLKSPLHPMHPYLIQTPNLTDEHCSLSSGVNWRRLQSTISFA